MNYDAESDDGSIDEDNNKTSILKTMRRQNYLSTGYTVEYVFVMFKQNGGCLSLSGVWRAYVASRRELY